MASAFTHAFAAVSLGRAILPPVRRGRIVALGAILSILPDADVVGFALGIPYGHLLGHRGLSHSLLFAAFVGLALAFPLARQAASSPRQPTGIVGPTASWGFRRYFAWLGAYFFVATASHGLFDALTDGGLGIAFFSPFDTSRYFLPWRPVLVAPIGLHSVFTTRSLVLFASEVLWIWLPWTLLCGVLYLGLHTWRQRP